MSNIDDILKTMDILRDELKQFKAQIQFAQQMAKPTQQATVGRKRIGRPPRNGPPVDVQLKWNQNEAEAD